MKSISRFASLAIAGFVALASPASAADAWNNGGISIRVQLKDTGRNARFFNADNTSSASARAYYGFKHMEAKLGEDYDIALTETAGTRIKLCVAVDGRSVMDGRAITNPEANADWGSCYVANPYQEVVIKGWRDSRSSVKQFYFTRDQNALAAWKWGDYGAMGTVVVAVFREQPRHSEGALRRGGGVRSLGTGAGETVESRVHSVEFRSQPYATDVSVIHYDTLDGLRKIGVKLEVNGSSFGRYGDADEKFIDFGRPRR